MRRAPLILFVAACLAEACAAAPSSSQAPPPAPTLRVASAPPTPPAGPRTPRASSGEFAPSPLTGLAQGLREIAFAALDGRALPASEIAVQPIREPSRLVRGGHELPSSADLTVLAFAMEITLALADPATARGSTDDERSSIRVIAFLSRAGLKVGSLELKTSSRADPVPAWLAGTQTFARDVLSALREHRIGNLLTGEAERPALSDDFLFERLMAERPKVDELREAELLAERQRNLFGVKLDEAFLVARDRTGAIWGLGFQIEEHHGHLELDSSPLLRVERLEKDRQRDPDLPPPPPPPPAPPPP